tara:strand:+ start:1539 stop:2786 length:1248 start_codon:yes stop_codon:yes gene_type:complete
VVDLGSSCVRAVGPGLVLVLFLVHLLGASAAGPGIRSVAPGAVANVQDFPWTQLQDGAQGFGSEATVRDFENLLRKPSSDDAKHLKALFDLPRDVDVWIELGRGADRINGVQQLLAGSLLVEDVEERIELMGRQPYDFDLTSAQALILVRTLIDENRTLRVQLSRVAAEEIEELRDAIAVLVSHTFGSGLLSDGEDLKLIAARADLAAMRLRALRKDLEVLADSPANRVERDSVTVLKLASALARGDDDAHMELLSLRGHAVRISENRRENSALGPLDEALDPVLDARREGRRVASLNYNRVWELLPDWDAFRPAPSDVAGMKKTDRYAACIELIEEGLAGDPLHAQLCFAKAMVVDFASGKEVSIPWFARYLALRGLTPNLTTSTQLHYLDPQDRYAYFRVRDEPTLYRPEEDD